jgi:pyridoxal phosphate enzyme (YggS family)
MSGISENLEQILIELPQNVKLVAVSKTKPIEDITEAYRTGHKIFGENKVQEIVYKHEKLPKDIEWHFIGHLQRNKVKLIVQFVDMIHSVDSLRLLEKINEEARNINKIVNCLLQIHIAEEETKYGFSEDELVQLLPLSEFNNLQNIKVCGLMSMATYTNDTKQIYREFKYLSDLFKTIKDNYFTDNEYFKEISIGMSGDYKIAVDCGSTMVRIGSNIFGERN